MKKEFIPYEQALALKELGFNEPCFASYVKEYKEFTTRSFADFYKEQQIYAPLYQQAFRWFREKCCIQNEVCFDDECGIHYYYVIRYFKNKKWEYYENSSTLTFKTYEEAELECLIRLIELVKKQE